MFDEKQDKPVTLALCSQTGITYCIPTGCAESEIDRILKDSTVMYDTHFNRVRGFAGEVSSSFNTE